jgi:acyl-coenzyme A thioesterase PaaI-like protein
VISIDAKTIKVGKRLAFLEVEISRKGDGVILARGIQTKFVG